MSDFTVQRAALPADRYTVVTNDFQRGKLPVPLRCVARCLLGYLLSLPADWVMDRPQLDESVTEGRDAVDAGLRELERTGYLVRSQHQAEGGRWAWTWRVTDDPLERPLAPAPSPGKPGMVPPAETANVQVTPCPGNPGTENQGVSKKTDIEKTDKEISAATATGDQIALLPGPVVVPKVRVERKPIDWTQEGLTRSQQATGLAQAHYERLGKMGRVPAFIAIIRKALEHDYEPTAVDAALGYIAENRWTLTEEKLANALRGGPKPPSRPAPAARRAVARTAGGLELELP
jgi:hypothetical protein